MYILEHTVNVLDWENCSLTPFQVEHFERYLKGFTAHLSDASVVGQAFHEITKTNIKKILSKIGIVRRKNDEYYIGDEKHNESSIVNMIRSTRTLHGLGQNASSPSKRRRSGNVTLTTLEVSTLRLWAVKSDLPLSNMPDSSTIGIGRSANKNDDNNAGDYLQAANSEEINKGINDIENKNKLVESIKKKHDLITIDSTCNECNRTADGKSQIEASHKVEVQSSTLDEDEGSSTNEILNKVDTEINDGADSDEIQGTKQQQKLSRTPSSIAEDETKEDLEVTATGTDDVNVDFKTPPPKNRRSTSSGTNITTTTSKDQDASSSLLSVGDDDRKPKSTHERRRHDSLSSAYEDDCEFSTPKESLEHENDKDLIMGDSETELLEPATENSISIDNTRVVVHHSSISNGRNNDKGTWGLSTQPPDTDDDDDDDGATQPSCNDNESILDMSEPAKLTPPPSTAAKNLKHHDHEQRTEQRCNRTPLFTQEDDDEISIGEYFN